MQLADLQGKYSGLVEAHRQLQARVEPLEKTAATAHQLAEQWPELKKQLETVEVSAKSVAGEATKAAEEAAAAKKAVDTALDEDAPSGIVGKLKARIEEAKKEGAESAGAVAKTVAMGVLQSYGLPAGIALAIIAFVVWDVRKKVKEGDPLLVEKVASRVHDRLGPVRERIVERVGDVRTAVKERISGDEQ
jgi:hypothetical protein